ncbi:MAG: YfaZ family outer membrane protein [Gammaproteobacteria bacterium]|nr:YfaZ family outer membrane protein [Gammaproteobacteria bacterium]
MKLMRPVITNFGLYSLLTLQLLITCSVNAQSLALEAGEKNINVIYRTAIYYDASQPVITDTRFLYSRQNNHQDLFASAGLTAFAGNSHSSGFNMGLGCRLVAADPLDYYLTAVTVGGELIFQPEASGSRLETSLYYAGESLSFSDARSVSAFSVNVDYKIQADRFIRLGYRKIRTQLNNGISSDFDRGAYLGLVTSF